MRSDHPRWTNPAMHIIKATDPATYDAMMNSEWLVITVDKPSELDSILNNDGPFVWLQIAEGLSTAFGVTNTDNPGQVPNDILNRTWLNRPNIKAQAGMLDGVTVPQFLADILVHEFKHHADHVGEREAFQASTEFARKMNVPALVKLSDDTYKNAGQYEDMGIDV